MSIARGLKISTIFITVFSTLFILCVSAGHVGSSVNAAMNGHDTTASSAASDTACTTPAAPCETTGRPHINVLPNNLATIFFIVVLGAALTALFFRNDTGRVAAQIRVHLRAWRDWGGGLRLHNFFQTLFASGILSPKIFDARVA